MTAKNFKNHWILIDNLAREWKKNFSAILHDPRTHAQHTYISKCPFCLAKKKERKISSPLLYIFARSLDFFFASLTHSLTHSLSFLPLFDPHQKSPAVGIRKKNTSPSSSTSSLSMYVYKWCEFTVSSSDSRKKSREWSEGSRVEWQKSSFFSAQKKKMSKNKILNIFFLKKNLI